MSDLHVINHFMKTRLQKHLIHPDHILHGYLNTSQGDEMISFTAYPRKLMFCAVQRQITSIRLQRCHPMMDDNGVCANATLGH